MDLSQQERTRAVRGEGKGGVKRGGQLKNIEKDAREVTGKKKE